MTDGFDEFSAMAVWYENGSRFIADQLAGLGGSGKIEVLAGSVGEIIICRIGTKRFVESCEIALIGFRLVQRHIREFGEERFGFPGWRFCKRHAASRPKVV